jgi:hypothetical protein
MTTMSEAVRNGVDTSVLFATLDAVKQQPELGRFQFRATNTWIDGAYNRSAIKSFFGAGQEDTSRSTAFHIDAGEPPAVRHQHRAQSRSAASRSRVLTTSLVYVAAARGVRLTRVESALEGDMDRARSDEVRNGFERVRVTFTVDGDGSP